MSIDALPNSSKQNNSKVQKDAAIDLITEIYIISTHSKTNAVKPGRINEGKI